MVVVLVDDCCVHLVLWLSPKIEFDEPYLDLFHPPGNTRYFLLGYKSSTISRNIESVEGWEGGMWQMP